MDFKVCLCDIDVCEGVVPVIDKGSFIILYGFLVFALQHLHMTQVRKNPAIRNFHIDKLTVCALRIDLVPSIRIGKTGKKIYRIMILRRMRFSLQI